MSKIIKIACTSDNYANLTDLRQFDDNPRELSDIGFKKLKRSILSLGLFKPLLVWKQENIILGGNQRYTVIEHLVGSEEFELDGPIPVTYVDCDEATARTIVLRDNQSDGDWAYELLADYMNDLEELGADLDLTGFTDKEMTDLKKLAQSSDELREQLEDMAADEDGEDMLKKKFGISLKIPEGDWDLYQDAMHFAKKETGTDDIWQNLKFLLESQQDKFEQKAVVQEEIEDIPEPQPLTDIDTEDLDPKDIL